MGPRKALRLDEPPSPRARTRSATKRQREASGQVKVSGEEAAKPTGRQTKRAGPKSSNVKPPAKKPKNSTGSSLKPKKKAKGAATTRRKPGQDEKRIQEPPKVFKGKQDESEASGDEPVAEESEPAKAIIRGRTRRQKQQEEPKVAEAKKDESETSGDEPVAEESEPAKAIIRGRTRRQKQQEEPLEASGTTSQQAEKPKDRKRVRETSENQVAIKRPKAPIDDTNVGKRDVDNGKKVNNNRQANTVVPTGFPLTPLEPHQSWIDKFQYNHKHYEAKRKKVGTRPRWPLGKVTNDDVDRAIFGAIGAVWRTFWESGDQYGLAIPKNMACALEGRQMTLKAIPGRSYELIMPLRMDDGEGRPVIVLATARAPATKKEPLEIVLDLFDDEDGERQEYDQFLAKAEQAVIKCGWWAFDIHGRPVEGIQYKFVHGIHSVPSGPNTQTPMATVFNAWAIMLGRVPKRAASDGEAADREKRSGVMGRQVLNSVLAGTYDMATIEAFLVAYDHVEETSMEHCVGNHAHPVTYTDDGCATGFVKGIASEEWKLALGDATLEPNSSDPERALEDPKGAPLTPKTRQRSRGAASPITGAGPENQRDLSPQVPVSFRRRRSTKLRTAQQEQWLDIYQSWCNKNQEALDKWNAKPNKTLIPTFEQLYEEHVFGGIGALWSALWQSGQPGQVFGFGRSDTYQIIRAGSHTSEINRLICGVTLGAEGSIPLIMPLIGYGSEFDILGVEEIPSPIRKSKDDKYRQRHDGHWILAVAERSLAGEENPVTLRIYDSLAGAEASEAMWHAAETVVLQSGWLGIDALGHPAEEEAAAHVAFDRLPMPSPRQVSTVSCGVSTVVNAWCYMLGIRIPAQRTCHGDDNDDDGFLRDVEIVIAQAMDGVVDAFGIRAFLYNWGYACEERLGEWEDEEKLVCRAVGRDCRSLNAFVTNVLKAENRVKLAEVEG